MNKLPVIISFISLIISLTQFIISIYAKRFTIKIHPIRFEKLETELYKKFFFQILVENKSNTPIAITNIKAITSSNEAINCCLTKNFIGESFKLVDGKENNKISYYSNEFPINIAPFGAIMPYIVFKVPKNKNIDIFNKQPNSLLLEVSTNRKVKTVCLNNFKELSFFDL